MLSDVLGANTTFWGANFFFPLLVFFRGEEIFLFPAEKWKHHFLRKVHFRISLCETLILGWFDAAKANSKFWKTVAQKFVAEPHRLRKWKNNPTERRLFCCWHFKSRQVTLSRIAVGNQLAGDKRNAVVLYSISDLADYNPTPTEKTKWNFWVWKKNAWKTIAETKNFCKKSLYLILKAYNEQLKNAENRFLTTKIGVFCGKKCGLPCWQNVTPFDRLFL